MFVFMSHLSCCVCASSPSFLLMTSCFYVEPRFSNHSLVLVPSKSVQILKKQFYKWFSYKFGLGCFQPSGLIQLGNIGAEGSDSLKIALETCLQDREFCDFQKNKHIKKHPSFLIKLSSLWSPNWVFQLSISLFSGV